MVDCSRLEGEDNFNYKKRLLDVFKYNRGSSKIGLLNALANELGLRKKIIWEDTSIDLVINDAMIIIDRIYVNSVIVELDDIYINDNGFIVLKGEKYEQGNYEVSYVSGIELHSLCDKNDKKLQSELFYNDGTATNLLYNYFNKIHTISPIVWDKFIWDNSYWNIIDKEIGGTAFIPNLLDGKINGFERYLK